MTFSILSLSRLRRFRVFRPPVLDRPLPAFFNLFQFSFHPGPKSTWEIPKTLEKFVLLRYPPIDLNPHLLNPLCGTPILEIVRRKKRADLGVILPRPFLAKTSFLEIYAKCAKLR